MASMVAKRLLLGEDIAIVNSEKVVVSGKKKSIIEKHKNKIENTFYSILCIYYELFNYSWYFQVHIGKSVS